MVVVVSVPAPAAPPVLVAPLGPKALLVLSLAVPAAALAHVAAAPLEPA